MSFGVSAIGTLPLGDGTGGSSMVYYDIALVGPADGSAASTVYPTFSSLPNSSDGSAVQVEWQWDTDPDFMGPTSQRQVKTTLGNPSGANASTTPDTALYNGPFYWRARAGNGVFWSSYTPTWTVDVPALQLVTSTYAYVNMGIEPLTASTDSRTMTYLNMGIEPLTGATDSTAVAYENMGMAPPQTTTVIRRPQGWGVIPSAPQTLTVLTKAATGTAEAYENIQ